MTGSIILAVDTCTRFASVALARGNEVLAELTWFAGLDHSRQLAPRVQSLMTQMSVAMNDLSAVAVATGPGSFNGIRTGMGFTKAVAFALGTPMVGISALEVQAYAHSASGLPVCVVQDAGRGELASAIYRNVRGRWTQVQPEAIISWEELEEIVGRPMLVCGDLYPNLNAELKRRLGTRALLSAPASSPRRAAYLAELAWRRIEQGEVLSPEAVQPLYLRRPAISERRKP